MCAISSLTSTFAISSPDEFLYRQVHRFAHGCVDCGKVIFEEGQFTLLSINIRPALGVASTISAHYFSQNSKHVSVILS